MKDSYYILLEEESVLANVYLIPMGDNQYYLTGLAVSKKGRGKGLAKKLIQQVCAEADNEKVTLFLDVAPDPDTDRTRLVTFYEGFGFKKIEGIGMRRDA